MGGRKSKTWNFDDSIVLLEVFGMSGPAFLVSGTGFWMPGAGFWMPRTGWTGFWMSGAGCCMPGTGFVVSGTPKRAPKRDAIESVAPTSLRADPVGRGRGGEDRRS